MARVKNARPRPLLALLTATSTLTVASAQATTYYFSGAVQVSSSSSGGTYSAAVPAQCPADHPVSCSSIGEPNYCCPASNNCAWSNSQVACCPQGQTCTGSVGGYQSTTYYQQQPPTTTYYTNPPPTQTTVGVIVPAGAATTVYQPQPQTTQHQNYGNGAYCSTIVEVGPNLPTTAQGNCGTVLIVAPAEAAHMRTVGWVRLGVMVVGLQVLGGVVLTRR